MKKLIRKLIGLTLLMGCNPAFADTPPQVINKQCSSHQWFSQIQPGPGNINCTQPTYADIGNTLVFINSIVQSGLNVSLVNDSASPGNSKYYGTNSIGSKGYFDLNGAITSGNLTDVGTDGITVTNGNGAVLGSGTSFAQRVSDTTHNGYLSSPDWNTFNSKQATLSIGTIDSQTPSANGAVIASNTLVLQSANGSTPGLMNGLSQVFSGPKAFGGSVAVNNLFQVLGDGSTTGFLVDTTNQSIFNSGILLNGNASAFPTSPTYDGDAVILKTNGSGSAPFDQAGSIIYRPRLSASTGRSQHLFYTGATPTLALKIDESQNVTIAGSIQASNFSGSSAGTNTGDVTLGAVGASANANAASLSGQILNLQPFSSSFPGVVTASGGGSSNFLRADGTWQAPAGTAGITALTGDVTATGPGSVAATLASVATGATVGSSTSIPTFTFNNKGLVTSASGNAVIAPAGTLSGTTLNSTVVSSSLTSVGTLGSLTTSGQIQVPAGTAAAPSYGFTSHSGTGIYDTGGNIGMASGSNLIAKVQSNYIMQLQQASAGTFSFLMGISDGHLNLGGDTGTSSGAQLNLYGASHATKPSYVEFVQGSTVALSIGASQAATFSGQIQEGNGTVSAPSYSFANQTGTGAYYSATGHYRLASGGVDVIDFGNNSGPNLLLQNTAAGSSFVYQANNDGLLSISGGTGSATGANIQLYGGTHATFPSNINFRQGSTVALSFGASQAATFNGTITGKGDGSNAGFNLDSVNRIGLSGAVGANGLVKVGSGINGLSGTSQYGVDVSLIANSSATSTIAGVVSEPNTAASAFTAALFAPFYAVNQTKGAGSTITRQVSYYADVPTQGANVAVLADNASFTGNYFINSTSTNASLLSGALTVNNTLSVAGNVSHLGLQVSSANLVTISNSVDLGNHIVNGNLLTINSTAATLAYHEIDNLSSTGLTQFIGVVGDGTTSSQVSVFTSRNRDSTNTYWHRGTIGDNNYSVATGSSTPTSATKYFTITPAGAVTVGQNSNSNTTQQLIYGNALMRSDTTGFTDLEIDNQNTSGSTGFFLRSGNGTTSSQYAYVLSQNRETTQVNWFSGTLGSDSYTVGEGTSSSTASVTPYIVVTTGGAITLGQASGTQTHPVNGDFKGATNLGWNITQSASGTSFTNQSIPIVLSNANATTNNWAGLCFADSSSVGASVSGCVQEQFSDRTNHYGNIAIGVRSAAGFLNEFQVGGGDAVTIGNSSSTAITVNGSVSQGNSSVTGVASLATNGVTAIGPVANAGGTTTVTLSSGAVYFLFISCSTTGNTALFAIGRSSTLSDVLAQDGATFFNATSGHASTVNITNASGVLTIQNNSGTNNLNFKIYAIRVA